MFQPLCAEAALNGLTVKDTVTDGDCGVDAFITSALAATKKSTRHCMQSLVHMSKADRLAAARKAACAYISKHLNQILWENFSLADLVRAGSGLAVGAYLERMKHKGAWVDAPFLHGLACAYPLDVLVMQNLPGATFALLGWSLTPGDKLSAQWTVPVALVNDFHYWALVPDTEEITVSSTKPSSITEPEAEELEDDPDSLVERDLSCQSGVLSKAQVEAELNLVQRLQLWNPWECPTSDLNVASCLQLMS